MLLESLRSSHNIVFVIQCYTNEAMRRLNSVIEAVEKASDAVFSKLEGYLFYGLVR